MLHHTYKIYREFNWQNFFYVKVLQNSSMENWVQKMYNARLDKES